MDIENIHEKCATGCKYNVLKSMIQTSAERNSALEKTNAMTKEALLTQSFRQVMDQQLLEEEKRHQEREEWKKEILDEVRVVVAGVCKELREENKKLNNNNQKLSEEVQRLNDNTQKLSEEVQKLSEEVQRLNDNTQKLSEEVQKLSEEVQRLNNNTQKLSEEVQKLNDNNQKLSEEVQKLSKEVQRLNNNNNKLTKRCHSMEEDFQALRKENQKLSDKVSQLQEALSQSDLEYKSMRWTISLEKIVCFVYEMFGGTNFSKNSIAHLDSCKRSYNRMDEQQQLEFLKHILELLETNGKDVSVAVSQTLLLDDFFKIDVEALKEFIDNIIGEMSKKQQ